MAYPSIRREILALRGNAAGFQPYRDPAPSIVSQERTASANDELPGVSATSSGSWNVFYLHLNHKSFQENLSRVPETTKAINEIFPRHYSHAFISALTPGARIKPHYGPSNRMLRVWLPICGCAKPTNCTATTDGNNEDQELVLGQAKNCATAETMTKVGLQVGDSVVEPKDGEPFAWDHSYEHWAWNLGDETRLVLIVDIWHPDLTADEVKFFGGMQNARLRMGRRVVEHHLAQTRCDEENWVDEEAENNLFAIVEKTRGLLTDDEWWVIKAERSNQR